MVHPKSDYMLKSTGVFFLYLRNRVTNIGCEFIVWSQPINMWKIPNYPFENFWLLFKQGSTAPCHSYQPITKLDPWCWKLVYSIFRLHKIKQSSTCRLSMCFSFSSTRRTSSWHPTLKFPASRPNLCYCIASVCQQ